MKTKLVLLIAALFIGVSFSQAEELKTLVTNKVKAEISYPEFAIKNGIEGDVLVSFKLDATGKFTVYQVNASDEDLKKYVVNSIENFKPLKMVASGEEHFHMKIHFELK